jgi:hypothetical protein
LIAYSFKNKILIKAPENVFIFYFEKNEVDFYKETGVVTLTE